MSVYSKFFLDFMDPFFSGLVNIFKGIFKGLLEMFNIIKYIDIVKEYASDLRGAGIAIVILTVLCLLALFGLLTFVIAKAIAKFIKYKRNVHRQQGLVEEIDSLNADLIKLKQQNEKLMAMADPETGEVMYDEEGNVINKLEEGESRFFKLSKIDEKYKEFTPTPITNNFNLNEVCAKFKNFAASKMKLFYNDEIIRLFISALASNKLIILEGISGTGKTSLAYAFGQFIKNDITIASVQPSWRDSTELFGYFNEFTKRFNETDLLSSLYEASYNKDKIYIALLDEMNISRVEYYFAEMLSVLELPNRNEWLIGMVPSVWANDPVHLINGKLKIPENAWYIGTINNDDSTFMVTDKVYDRAMPIAINEKYPRFDAPLTEGEEISYTYLINLYKSAQQKQPVSTENFTKLTNVDNYIVKNFKLAFGNRILQQIKDFVPVYVACGGDEVTAIDYIIAHKILRKFDQLNLAFVRRELDGFISYLNNLYGEGRMKECLEVLETFRKIV